MTPRTTIEAAGFTLPRAGGEPSDNEDGMKFASGKGSPDAWADFVAVVADGVGTSSAPAQASRAAVETWVQFLERRFSEAPDALAAFDETQFGHLLRECFAQAHRQVQRLAPGGSATAAGICVQGPWLLAATVGDARAYHFSGGTLHQLTEDQIDGGGNPTDVLGGRPAPPAAASYARRSLSPGDWIVACSDGLTKTVSADELSRILRSAEHPQAVVRTLRERAQAIGVEDDVTAVFARVGRVGAPFWEIGDRGSAIGGESAGTDLPQEAPVPAPPRNAAINLNPSPISDPQPPTPENPMNDSLTDFERRLERLERAPNGGALSPQENARLEREFDRLERRLQESEARIAGAARLPLWWALAALVLGLVLGAFLPSVLARTRGADPLVGGKGEGPVGIALQLPADASDPLEYRLTDAAVVLRYRTKTGNQKVALYPYALSGKPSVTYGLPREESATKYGKKESEPAPDGAGVSPKRSPSRPTPP